MVEELKQKVAERWQKELDRVQAGKRTGGDRRIYNLVEELKQKVTEGD